MFIIRWTLLLNYVINLLLHFHNESVDRAFRTEEQSPPQCAHGVHLEAKGEMEVIKKVNKHQQCAALQTMLLKDDGNNYF